MPKFNHAGEALLKSHEGLKLAPYRDAAGVWTIGYGHTRGVTGRTPPITQAMAERWLDEDVCVFVELIDRLVRVPLNDNQFSALVCLCYNEGTKPLHQTLGTKLNAGNYRGAAEEFMRWVYVKGEASTGLMVRRAAEKALFLTPQE